MNLDVSVWFPGVDSNRGNDIDLMVASDLSRNATEATKITTTVKFNKLQDAMGTRLFPALADMITE
ncbi:MAG: hypothetical protein WCK89_14785 [bacterium]